MSNSRMFNVAMRHEVLGDCIRTMTKEQADRLKFSDIVMMAPIDVAIDYSGYYLSLDGRVTTDLKEYLGEGTLIRRVTHIDQVEFLSSDATEDRFFGKLLTNPHKLLYTIGTARLYNNGTITVWDMFPWRVIQELESLTNVTCLYPESDGATVFTRTGRVLTIKNKEKELSTHPLDGVITEGWVVRMWMETEMLTTRHEYIPHRYVLLTSEGKVHLIAVSDSTYPTKVHDLGHTDPDEAKFCLRKLLVRFGTTVVVMDLKKDKMKTIENVKSLCGVCVKTVEYSENHEERSSHDESDDDSWYVE